MTIHTAFGDGEIVETDRGRMGKTRYKVAGFGFEVWLDATDPAIRTATDLFTYAPEMEMLQGASHIQGTPTEAPHFGGGHSGGDAWGLQHHSSNPRDRAGDSWADSRDRGQHEHGQQDLYDDYSDYGSAPADHHSEWGRFNDPELNLEDGRYTTESHGYHQAASFDFEPTDHVNEDNSTTLPYDWQPQFPVDMFRHEQTQSPDHMIDRDERMKSTDSRTGEPRERTHKYPGPNPDLFAKSASYPEPMIPEEHRAKPGEPSWQDHVNEDAHRVQEAINADTSNPAHPDYLPPHHGAWERPAGLSSKYADVREADYNPNDPIQRFVRDPQAAIVRHGSIDLDAGLDRETGEWMDICRADKSIRTAAWKDVRGKAVRLVREGNVHVEAMDSNAIYANVDGDNGTYECMILTGAAYPNGGFKGGKRAIANWKCNCFLPDAPIMLADGTERPISEIQVGDEVITHTGQVRRVVEIRPKPFDGLLARVRVAGDNREFVATSEHRVYGANSDRSAAGDGGWAEIGSLKPGDYLSRPILANLAPVLVTVPRRPGHASKNKYGAQGVGYNNGPKGGRARWTFTYKDGGRTGRPVTAHFLTQGEAVEASNIHHAERSFVDVKVDADLAYWLGWYAAEGSLVQKPNGYRVAFSLSIDERWVAEQLDEISWRHFGVRGTIRELPERGTIDYRVSDHTLYRLAEALVGTGSRTKKLSAEMLRLPAIERGRFLAGYLGGDGSVEEGGRCTISTTSHDLAYQTREMLSLEGYKVSVRREEKNVGGLLTTQNAGPIYHIRWSTQKDSIRQYEADGSMWHRIESVNIEPYVGEVWDIEVEGDHSFRAFGWSVHNCDWGKWAFKRQFTFVGRLCSHGYATYLTQQSHNAKNDPHHFKKRSSVDEFKKWVKEENGGHIDIGAVDSYLTCCDESPTPEEAQKLFDYVDDHHSEHPERNYEQDSYSNNPDDAYKTADVLRHQPGKLTPHIYEVPDEHYHEFEDLGDDRKTTGPDQIQARRRTAKGEAAPSEHHPAFAWHADGEDDMPETGIVHFSSLKLLADENLLDKLRDLGNEQPSEHFHDCQDHNKEVSEVVQELNDRGYAASPLVAMKSAALWRVARPDDDNYDGPTLPLGSGAGSSGGGKYELGFGGDSPHPAPTPGGDASGLSSVLPTGVGSDGTVQHTPAGPGSGAANSGAGTLQQALGYGGGAPAGGPALAGETHPAGGAPAPAGASSGHDPNGAPTPGLGTSTPPASLPGGHPGGSDLGPGGTYTVKPGDTESGIANQFHTTTDAITKANPGNVGNSGTNLQTNNNLIHPGDSFKVPGASGASGVDTTDYSKPAGELGKIPGTGPGALTTPTGGDAKALGTPGMQGLGMSPGSSGSGAGNAIKSLTTPGSGMPGGKIGAQRFAELYFQAADDDNDPNKKQLGPAPSTSPPPNAPGTPGGQGGPYKQVTNPNTPVNAPRSSGGGATPGTAMAPDDIHGTPAANPAGAQDPTTVSGAPGQKKMQDQSVAGGAGGIGGGANGMSMIGPVLQGLTGLGESIIPSAISGLSGVLTKLLSKESDPRRFASLYMQADGAFETPGGPDWMDYSFAGSGPDRQDWSTTSEDYVKEHERPNHQETWMTDNEGDIVKYTDDRPKQGPGKKSSAEFARRYFQADTGMGGSNMAPAMSSGGLSTGGSGMGQGTGGAFEGSTESSGPTMGELGGMATASISGSSRSFWADIHEADAFHSDEQGYFNPRNPSAPAPRDPESGNPKGKGKKPGVPGEGGSANDAAGVGAPAAEEGIGSAATGGGVAQALQTAESVAPLVGLASYDSSDVVRRFQASGGGCINLPSGGPAFDDDAIAKQAQRMLRTAGRNYTPAEQRELEEEFHPKGARNLSSLNLAGTHYEDE